MGTPFGDLTANLSAPQVDRIWCILVGLYLDNGTEHENYYVGFRVSQHSGYLLGVPIIWIRVLQGL